MARLAAHPSGLHTAKERERALRWLAGLAEADRARILANAVQANAAASTWLPGVGADDIPYIALLLEIRRFGFDAIRRRGYRAAGPEQFAAFERVRESRAKNLVRERPSPLREKVLLRWAMVKELHSQGLGFRLISRYFSQQLRIPVSPSYLRKMWLAFGQDGADGRDMP